jgi:taurine--2-oxoglutarate transaminase
MQSEQLRQRYKKSVFIPWQKQQDAEPLMIKEANGVYLNLENGEKLLDMKSSAFCANLGHNHAGMQKAIATAAARAEVVSSETFCPERLGLAEDLLRIAPKTPTHSLEKTFFTLGGAEANENAIKVARMFTKRHKIVTRYRSYHGASLATINFSGDYRRIPVDNAITGVVRFPDPYPRGSGQTIDTVRLLEEIIEIEGPETIAAIMLEGITGANGVFIPPADYWPRIRQLADNFGILLIADEVLSGFWRTGKWWGVDNFKVAPDILTMSKGLTAGYMPLGAMMVNQAISKHFESETLSCGLTQYGHSLSCAAGRAAIGFYENDGIGENVRARGQELSESLKALSLDHALIAETRSIGLLAAIDLAKPGAKDQPLVPYRAVGDKLKPTIMLQKALREHGISTVVRYSTIIIAPPLTISGSELREGMMGIDGALKLLAESK